MGSERQKTESRLATEISWNINVERARVWQLAPAGKYSSVQTACIYIYIYIRYVRVFLTQDTQSAWMFYRAPTLYFPCGLSSPYFWPARTRAETQSIHCLAEIPPTMPKCMTNNFRGIHATTIFFLYILFQNYFVIKYANFFFFSTKAADKIPLHKLIPNRREKDKYFNSNERIFFFINIFKLWNSGKQYKIYNFKNSITTLKFQLYLERSWIISVGLSNTSGNH